MLLAALMLLSSAVQSIASHQYFHIGFRVGMKVQWLSFLFMDPPFNTSLFQVRAALVMAVYRKAFKMSGAARQQSTVGEIVNQYHHSTSLSFSQLLLTTLRPCCRA